jgi:hypothetical protein
VDLVHLAATACIDIMGRTTLVHGGIQCTPLQWKSCYVPYQGLETYCSPSNQPLPVTTWSLIKVIVLSFHVQATTTLLSCPVVPWPHVLGPILFFRLQGTANSSTRKEGVTSSAPLGQAVQPCEAVSSWTPHTTEEHQVRQVKCSSQARTRPGALVC